MVNSARVCYVAHGRAGLEVAHLLLEEIRVLPENILVFTYDVPENRELVDFCERLGVRWSFASIRSPDSAVLIEAFSPTLVVSMHARELIPGRVLKAANLGGINLHPSLLPKYRGCLSGVWAMVNGEKATGISYHFMNEKFDDGLLILQKEIPLTGKETGHSLFNQLIDVGVAHFVEAFRKVVDEKYAGHPQVGEPSYYPRNLPYEGVIDPQWTDEKIKAFIRALNFPGRKGAVLRTTAGEREVLTFEEYLKLKPSAVRG